RLKLQTVLRYADAKTDIDIQGGSGGDDPNATTQTRQLIAGLRATKRFLDDHLKSSLAVSYVDGKRSGLNRPDIFHATDSSDQFRSAIAKVESDHELALGESHTLRADLQWRSERGLSTETLNGARSSFAQKSQSLPGAALTYLYDDETRFFDIGARGDLAPPHDVIPSLRASVGSRFLEHRAKVSLSYGTGFKIPSLYQRYSVYGEKTLHEETSDTVELSVDHQATEKISLGLTIFENHFRSLIDYDTSANHYFNVSRAMTRGLEAQTSFQALPSLKLGASYDYLESSDAKTGLALLRRPKNAWNVSASYAPDAWETIARYRFKGARADADPTTFARIESASYGVLSLESSYLLSKRFKVHGRIENVFNTTYEEVAGYGNAGVSFFLGLTGEI
ncbi:MAG: TonB-dependent receptor, partial [Bdellovibrionota bacterium]